MIGNLKLMIGQWITTKYNQKVITKSTVSSIYQRHFGGKKDDRNREPFFGSHLKSMLKKSEQINKMEPNNQINCSTDSNEIFGT